MFFRRRHNYSNEKAAILREVYHDNLKMAGKPIDTRAPMWRSLVKPFQAVAVMLVVALLPFSEVDPALYASSNHVLLPATDKQGYNSLLSAENKVRLLRLFGLGVQTIVIDPGHGGEDPGAIGANGLEEKDVTLEVALKLKEKLKALGRYHVLLTRETDCTLALTDRVYFAKKNKADLFISIHVNSIPNKRLNIIETYYFGAPLTSEAIDLAERENQASHFSVGELNGIIQDLGNTVKRQESEKLATAIQESLFKNIKQQDTQALDYGVKMAPFVVLAKNEIPSVLVEISCLTKAREEKRLASSNYRAQIASYIEDGVVAYLED